MTYVKIMAEFRLFLGSRFSVIIVTLVNKGLDRFCTIRIKNFPAILTRFVILLFTMVNEWMEIVRGGTLTVNTVNFQFAGKYSEEYEYCQI